MPFRTLRIMTSGAFFVSVLLEQTSLADSNGEWSILYSFTGGEDGNGPYGSGLIQGRDGNLYGVTMGGGTYMSCLGGCGTIYKITPEGTLTTLHSFDPALD